MCKLAGLLIGWDFASKRAIIAHGQCDSWECEECAARMASRWKMRAAIGARAILANHDFLDFCTITSHEALKTFAATETVWRSAWAMLYAKLKRHRADFQYMIVPEKHQDGRMHVHVMWNACVGLRWLKNAARTSGLGYEADVSHIVDAGAASLYVVKYLAKNLGEEAPPHFRRVRVSQGWPDIPRPDNSDAKLLWEYTNSPEVVMQWLHECQTKHLTVIDQKSGEAFDYMIAEWAGEVSTVSPL